VRSVICFPLILALFGASPLQAADETFSQFIREVKLEAKKKGISEKYVNVLDGLTPDPEILRLAARQPEFVKPIWAYLLQMVTPERLALGRAQLAEREAFLAKLEEKYGVPRTILVAIWGVETNYGGNKGSHSVLQALATLGYTGKRAEFGRQQLLAALKILQSGDVELTDFKGSWAGAMGHTQFIPTTYEGYAADGSGDGVRDIWAEPKDALASSANYLKRMGWSRGLEWGFEVQVPVDMDFSVASLKQPKPAAFWRDMGVSAPSREISDGLGDISLFAPTGARGPIFLVTKNFRALLRYNTAPAYALAVAHLGDRFTREAPFTSKWPMADRPLLPKEISTMQSALMANGFDVGGVDGLMGSKTAAAVRAFQKSRKLIVDGYATPGILMQLRDAK
tara:strand:- start:2258 stop:3445 length:1188 start_codon:yes stop_codon:yes gene_type:complete